MKKLCKGTLVAVYILVGIGAMVRATGAGMGCPDWPTCFGGILPPTTEQELPVDYKETFMQHRIEKNIKFAKYLSFVGLKKTAQSILANEDIAQATVFNPVKTWTEYVNRVAGVIVGLCMIALAGVGFAFLKLSPRVFWLSIVLLGITIFQGWFGSIVVSTHLTPWTVSVHYILALLIIALLVYLYSYLKKNKDVEYKLPFQMKWMVVCTLILVSIQLVLGIQLREKIELLALDDRSLWAQASGMTFIIHRSFSWLVLLSMIVLYIFMRKAKINTKSITFLLAFVIASSITGTILGYFSMPWIIQPLHVMFGAVCFGTILYVFWHTTKPATV